MTSWHLRQGVKYAVAGLPSFVREPWILQRGLLIQKAERRSPEYVRNEQLTRLNRILRWAAVHVPYYRARGMEATLPLRSLEDLKRWPVVDRSAIAADPELFCAEGIPAWRVRSGTTTGRSGRALSVRWEWPAALWWERAFHSRLFRWAGLPRGFRRVVLRGGLVDAPGGPESRWWQLVPHERALVLSVYQLSEATVTAYVRAMQRFRPHALQAYPSAAAKIARLASEAGAAIPPLTAVLTSSESLVPEDRLLIEDVMRAPVFDFYGHAERAVAAAQCERREGYHLFEDYGYTEILDQAGSPVGEGSSGEIVATGFHNRAMPFIRYRTGDQAALAEVPCPCGRPFRVLKTLEGRPPDYLIGADGLRISLRFGLGSKDLAGIWELRFFQSRPGVADLRYVGAPDPALVGRLHDALRRRTGEAVLYRIQRVDRLPAGPGGKALLVIHEDDES